MAGCGRTRVLRLLRCGCRAAVHFRIGLRFNTLLIDAGRVATMHPVKDGFRFGRFELDVRARELRKDGVRLRLQDQPFEALVMLLEQPGEVLTRDELRRRLWRDGTFVDFEHGLNAAVKRLRAALGDNADRPRFVETLNRRGYRFIGAVDRIEPERPHASGKVKLTAAAHQAFLKGRYHWNKAGATGVEEAVAFYEQAVALDPDFAAAHASLARAHVAAAEYYLREPRGALEAGRLAATRALELDPGDSDAHLALAEIRKTVDVDGAEAAYRLALAFNPSSEAAHRVYGLFLAARGRIAEAALAVQRACDLDPLCLVVNTSAAWVRYLGREYDEAIGWCRHTLDMDPQFGPAYRVLAAALVETGRIDEGISVFERAMEAQPDAVSATWLAHALARRGDTARAIEILEPLERAPSRYVSPYHRALAYTALDRTDTAVALLHAAFEAADPAIVNLAAEPRFERLRADARYGALAERLVDTGGTRNGQR